MSVKEQAKSMISARPRSFAALMDMYEANYMQLRLFLGDARRLPGDAVSQVAGHLPVYLEVKERSQHTTILLLTYLFGQQPPDEPQERRPDMLVRIYHDARQAEVITHKCRFNDGIVKPWQRDVDSMLLCRWRMNRFLFKWVRYLRRQGHSFESFNRSISPMVIT